MLALLVTGCASVPAPSAPSVPANFPPNALVTQRAILTARGRQYALNGYLALSESGGKRLIVAQSFGQAVADILVSPDGIVHVLRSSPMVRPAWAERYLASDLQCLVGAGETKDCPLRTLSPSHFVIKRRWYELDVQIVEIKPGSQPAELFDPGSSSRP